MDVHRVAKRNFKRTNEFHHSYLQTPTPAEKKGKKSIGNKCCWTPTLSYALQFVLKPSWIKPPYDTYASVRTGLLHTCQEAKSWLGPWAAAFTWVLSLTTSCSPHRPMCPWHLGGPLTTQFWCHLTSLLIHTQNFSPASPAWTSPTV